jgi:murein DD-endopeptidase MepM/ murein hydrolase activator NlpD
LNLPGKTVGLMADMQEKEKKKWGFWLKNRYRMVIMNEETLEEKASFNLQPRRVFVSVGLGVILLITITTFIIAFTPLREYIPGYADVKSRRQMVVLLQRTDSLEKALNARDLYLRNLRNIIDGKIPSDSALERPDAMMRYDTIRTLERSIEDSLLRQEIESQDPYSIAVDESGSMTSGIRGFLFFPPVKGNVTNRFDRTSKHFAVDIVAPANEPVKSTLDGTVVIANFTAETGWIIGIQHSNNLFSFYKHNSALLKKTGDFVKAGEVVAVIGNSGEFSSGPHLHFELWFNGSPLDPLKYVSF